MKKTHDQTKEQLENMAFGKVGDGALILLGVFFSSQGFFPHNILIY
jgi:hypothetical protein